MGATRDAGGRYTAVTRLSHGCCTAVARLLRDCCVTQESENELTRKKNDIPLEVLIGSQINQKNVSDLMKIWDKGGDGVVTKEEFRQGLVQQKIETNDAQIDRERALQG